MVKYICNDCLDPDPCEIIVADGSDVPSCCPFRLTWKAVNWHEASENLQDNIQDKQDKPLPKLTAEVFNHPDCPEWAKYAAVNKDGSARVFEFPPKIVRTECWYTQLPFQSMKGLLTKFDSSDWHNSLIERPEKKTLPDWCKQGEWIYTSSEQYLKIEGISIDLQKIELSNGATWSKQDIIDEAVPARLRPYNAEELMGLVGKVLNGNDFNFRALILYAESTSNTIETLHYSYTAEELKQDYTIDGKPAGVLEHLENGEWVQ